MSETDKNKLQCVLGGLMLFVGYVIWLDPPWTATTRWEWSWPEVSVANVIPAIFWLNFLVGIVRWWSDSHGTTSPASRDADHSGTPRTDVRPPR